MTKKNSAAVAADAGRPRSSPTSRGRRRPTERARDGRGHARRRRQRQRPLPRRTSSTTGSTSSASRSRTSRSSRHRTGRRTGARSSASASRTRRRDGDLRHRALEGQEGQAGVLGRTRPTGARASSSPTSTPRARACSTPRSRPTASSSRSCPTWARRPSGCGSPTTRRTSRSSSAKQTAVRACKVTWRGDSQGAAGRPGRRDLRRGRRARSCASPPTTSASEKELNPSGDDPSYQPLTIGG